MTAVDLGIAGLGPGTPIGRGGFGTVYRAEQPAFRRTVAVKVLDGTLDERAQRRFERECQAMGSLSDHPGIVTIFDAGVDRVPGAPYLVMAFQPGGSVADRLAAEGRLPWADGLRIGVEVAEALAAAHRMEVLHRDVKPANILLSGYGHAQLGDFGIARVTGATQTRGDQVTASLLYAPPEILHGTPRGTGQRHLQPRRHPVRVPRRTGRLRRRVRGLHRRPARAASPPCPCPTCAPRACPTAWPPSVERAMAKDPGRAPRVRGRDGPGTGRRRPGRRCRPRRGRDAGARRPGRGPGPDRAAVADARPAASPPRWWPDRR